MALGYAEAIRPRNRLLAGFWRGWGFGESKKKAARSGLMVCRKEKLHVHEADWLHHSPQTHKPD
jgi:hypothetical protein